MIVADFRYKYYRNMGLEAAYGMPSFFKWICFVIDFT